ncbi:MAG: 50S ribosomal protein L5 [Patescibacteria group bacterium]
MNKILAQVNQKLKIDFNKANIFELPKISKVVVNVGIGSKAKTDGEYLKKVSQSLAEITGQKPAERLARKAISGFKVRQGESVGLQVTLRGKRMIDFIYKLVHIVLPRTRDFRGLSQKGFDNNGNYTFGFSEQNIFGEMTDQKSEIIHGMSISLVTTAKNHQAGEKLLAAWGFPFEKKLNLGK